MFDGADVSFCARIRQNLGNFELTSWLKNLSTNEYKHHVNIFLNSNTLQKRANHTNLVDFNNCKT